MGGDTFHLLGAMGMYVEGRLGNKNTFMYVCVAAIQASWLVRQEKQLLLIIT